MTAATVKGRFTLAGVTSAHAAGQPDGTRPLPGDRRRWSSPAIGIKPYSGFFGALKVSDAVDFEVEVDVPASQAAPA